MDDWTLLHLEQWLNARVRWNEIDLVRAGMLAYLEQDPGAIERGLTWTEIRNHAEAAGLIVYEGGL